MKGAGLKIQGKLRGKHCQTVVNGLQTNAGIVSYQSVQSECLLKTQTSHESTCHNIALFQINNSRDERYLQRTSSLV